MNHTRSNINTYIYSKMVDKNIRDLYEKDITKKWIKLIDKKTVIEYDNYNRKSMFIHVADVLLDNDVKNDGTKKRNTLIIFKPVIQLKEFNDKTTEWIYIFTINNNIVKIGGTRTGLKGRVGSYLCGHHVKERGKSGDCSKTNGFIYNTFVFYLQLKFKIKMYAYKLPKAEIEIDIFNAKQKILVQTFHIYENTFFTDYKKTYDNIPVLCDNY